MGSANGFAQSLLLPVAATAAAPASRNSLRVQLMPHLPQLC
jgi:hypothetical protein